MKYAYNEATELVDGPEITVDGVEILDTGDVSFDPPQFTQISQVPQVFEQVENGLGYGPVTGLNRGGQDGESTGNCTPQQLVWGMDSEKYKIVDNGLVPLTQEEVDVIDAASDLDSQVAEIKPLRFERETADLVYDGMLFPYGREDRTLLESACDKIRRGLVLEIEWKCVDGYYALNLANIDALEIAGLTQVQEAFAWEKVQVELLTTPVE